MRVLLDLNVILDVLLEREPHGRGAAEADGCALLVSRDRKGITSAPLPVQDAVEALSTIRIHGSAG